MKFKIESKDFVLFIIYSIVLLYLCSVVVLNFASFANEGVFYGLVPFKAFLPPYLTATLILFFAAQVIVFTSVSSYIFNKEKGPGVGLKFEGKSSDGYARWAKEKEIITQKDVVKVDPLNKEINASGVPLINDGKNIYVDNGEYHNLVIGSTGSGKTECLVKPMVNILGRKGESMIITDPKGEIYRYTAENLKSKGYNIVLLNFRDPQKGNAWNPLALPYHYYKEKKIDKATELLNDVALNILYDQANKNDPFWEKTSADYFAGLALGLFQDAKEPEVNLNSINVMSTIGEERYAANSTYIKEYFTLKGESSSPYIFASSTISAPSDTKGSILSTFRQKIRLFSSTENLSEMLAYSDFDMRDIGKKKTAVFLVIHDEKKTYHSLMTIFIKQCYETLIDVAHENGGKLEYRTNFILDEFANMPPLKDVDSMISAARSRDIRFTFIIQNYAQLSEVYGEHVAEVIKGNCSNLIYLISTELKALEEISKMCGEVKSKEKDKTASTPLITVSDLQKLKLFQAIIIRLRTNPFKTQLKPNFKIEWGEEFFPSSYPNRKMREVEIFDVKKYVTEEKKKRALEMPNSVLSGSPHMGYPPFGSNAGVGSLGNNIGMNQPLINPFMPQKQISDLDIDAMMRDIDKKIKELEDQEKQEQVNKKTVSPQLEVPTAKSKPKVELPDKVQQKPKINIDVDSRIVGDNIVSDDEFFDDFFDEDA